MRRWKSKSKKNLYLLDNREYTKKQNGDVTSPPQVLALYIYNRQYEIMRNGDATSPLVVPTLYICIDR